MLFIFIPLVSLLHWLSYDLAADSLAFLSKAMFTFLLSLFLHLFIPVSQIYVSIFLLLRFKTSVYMLSNMNKFLKREIV